jgi:toxin ParE1/3/4
VKIRWLKRANRSLRLIHKHITATDPQGAKYVVQGIREATKRLAIFPGSGRPGQVAGTRELVMPRWPYIVVYRVAMEEVQILRVFHQATDWWHTEVRRDIEES